MVFAAPHKQYGDTVGVAAEGHALVEADLIDGAAHVLQESLSQLPQPPTHVFVAAEAADATGFLAAAAHVLPARAPGARLVAVERLDADRSSVMARTRAAAASEGEGGGGEGEGSMGCVPDLVAVGDAWVSDATRRLYHEHRVAVSPGGAAAYAGLIAALRGDGDGATLLGLDSNARVLVVLSEGVGDPARFNRVVGPGACGLTTDELGVALLGMDGGPSRTHSAATEASMAATSLGAFKPIRTSGALFPSTDSLRSVNSSTVRAVHPQSAQLHRSPLTSALAAPASPQSSRRVLEVGKANTGWTAAPGMTPTAVPPPQVLGAYSSDDESDREKSGISLSPSDDDLASFVAAAKGARTVWKIGA